MALALVGCSERLEWREFRSADGYSVMLPGRAQTVARDVEFEGHKLPVSMTSTGVGSAMFALGMARLPAVIADDAAGRERAIAFANSLATKRVIPLVVCFLPGLFVWTLGPAFVQLFKMAETFIQVRNF